MTGTQAAKLRRRAAAEPQVTLEIGGKPVSVAQSLAPLEQAIAKGFQLQARLDELVAEHAAVAPGLQQRIEAYRAELRRAEQELQIARAATEMAMSVVEAELSQVKQQIWQLAMPLLGEQQSLKYQGVAGPVEIARRVSLEIQDGSALRKLLGQRFPEFFSVTEKIKPLKTAVQLLTTLKGAKLTAFRKVVAVEETGSVRFGGR